MAGGCYTFRRIGSIVTCGPSESMPTASLEPIESTILPMAAEPGGAVPPSYRANWAELASQVEGELHWDPIHRTLYASSASIIEIWPSAVLVPRCDADVVAALAFCARHRIPVTCRGAGSGVVGQSLGRGLIIDFSVHMNRIFEVNLRDGWALVEPGVVKDDLDALLAQHGHFWPPDPSSSPWCTVGAMVANNSGGAKSVMYGTARDYLLELDCLTYDGQPFKLRPIEIAPEGRLLFASDATATEKRLALHAYRLVSENRELLRQHAPKATRCSSGYNLFQLLDANTTFLDMPRLFCGSEGSLAVLLRARVRVVPLPKKVAGCALSFESDQRMAHAVVELLAKTRPAKLELLDRSFIDVAAKAEPELAAGIPDRLKTLLVAEFFGDSEEDTRKQVDQAIAVVTDGQFSDGTPLCFAAEPAYDPRGLDRLWRIRKVASPILSRVKGDNKPTRWIEDIAVPPWKLPEFIAGIKQIFADGGFPAALFGHAGEGNLHVNPTANLKDPECRERMLLAADKAWELTKSLGGVISGEHGDGTMRSPYLRKMFGPAYDLMVEVKREWDPFWLMNPLTKVLPPEEEARRHTLSDARVGEGYARHATGTALDRPAVLEEIEKCHGCGKCRVYCPLMQVSLEEKHTARAKANLLRAVVAGRLDPAAFLGDQAFRENIDLCINCGQCLVECPTQVDIPGIAMAFREQFIDRGGDAGGVVAGLLAKPDLLGKAASLAPGLANSTMGLRWLRGVAELATGLDRRRELPEYQREQGLPAKAPLELPPEVRASLPQEVVLFPGCWANYNDPDGEKNAAIRIMQALGVTVHQPSLACCGISKVTMGKRDAARKEMQANLRLLLPFVERGAKILFSAPSCLLATIHDMPRVVGTPEAKLVAEACVDAHKLLYSALKHPDVRSQLRPVARAMMGEGALRSEQHTAAYHMPCHSKVAGVGMDPLKLLELIPEERVDNLNAGCCGLSGTFGMKTSNFDMSMAIGRRLFTRITEREPDAVVTPCGVCQTQIRQGAPDARVMHPLRLVYEALSPAVDA